LADLLENKPKSYKKKKPQSPKTEFLILDVIKRVKALEMSNRTSTNLIK